MSQRLHDLAGVQEVGPVGRIAKEDRLNPDRRGWRWRRDRDRRRDRLRRGLRGRREGRLVDRPDLLISFTELNALMGVDELDALEDALSGQQE